MYQGEDNISLGTLLIRYSVLAQAMTSNLPLSYNGSTIAS